MFPGAFVPHLGALTFVFVSEHGVVYHISGVLRCE